MKRLLTLFFAIFCLANIAQSQNVVQLAAYNSKVSNGYFSQFSDVKYYTDYQGFIHYYVEKTESQSLEDLLAQAQSNGYPKAYILDLSQLQACNTCCGSGKIDRGVIRDIPKRVYSEPVVSNCNVPSFSLNGEEDMEIIRYVIEKNPSATVMMIECPKNEKLNCYLGVRGIQACGIGYYSRADLKKEIGCAANCGTVYLKSADGEILDVRKTFMDIVKS